MLVRAPTAIICSPTPNRPGLNTALMSSTASRVPFTLGYSHLVDITTS